MKTTTANRSAGRSKAFTLTEVLVVIAIISVLAVLLLGATNYSRASSANVRCISNLRSLGQASIAYAGDNNGKLPVPEAWGLPADELYWWRIIRPYLPQEEYTTYGIPNIFRCPRGEGHKLFAEGARGESWALVDYATVLLYPGNTQYSTYKVQLTKAPLLVDGENYSGNLGLEPSTFRDIVNDGAKARHSGGVNVLHVGGHVEAIKEPTAEMFFPTRQ